MLIPEHKIEEVLERVDLVGLISRHVDLKKSGREFKGRCPFHQEKTPSFYVVPEKRFYFCHGCRASGDAVSFIQRYLGKTFVDAVKDLAREVGVDVEAAEDPSRRERQELKEATDAAAEHFRQLLWDEKEGRTARAYLASRGVSEECAKAFGLGWAPVAWSSLADHLTRQGMVEWGVKAGLIQKRQKGEGYYDFFRSRLIIPIRAPEGRNIAFGGRLMESGTDAAAPEGPKYLNSRESRLYQKSETLYGMDQARDEIRRRKAAVLVEGYFDCIGLHQAGVKHAVALCSTALTAGHLQILARAEARELYLLLDGDRAGLDAVERLAGALLAQGTATKVALLPQGEDPDTFARREGKEGVERLLEGAQGLTEYLFVTLLPQGSAATFEDKMKALERLKPTSAQLPVGLLRSAFFSAAARHFGLPAAELESALRGKAPPVRAVPKATPPARVAAPVRPPDALEAAYVAVLLKEPRLFSKDGFRVCDDLSHPALRSVLAETTHGQGSGEALFEAADNVKRALELAGQQLPADAAALEGTFLAICRKLKLRRIDDQLKHISLITTQSQAAHELSEDMRQLMSQRTELLALKKRVVEDLSPAHAGTKSPMQPV